MRKTIAVAAATGALFFGGAGIANADVTVPASTTSTLAAEPGENDDNSGLWGLTGLLGLVGLLGLRRRTGHDTTGTRAGIATSGTGRATTGPNAGTSMGTSGASNYPTAPQTNPGNNPPTV